MAVSLNSVIGFSPTAKYHTRTNVGVSLPKVPSIVSLSRPVGLIRRQSTEGKRSRFYLLASHGDNVVTETTDTDSKTSEESYSEDGSSGSVSDVNSSATDDKVQPSDEGASTPQVSQLSNRSTNTGNLNQEPSAAKPSLKRSSLTARERLRAARVLSRYTESPKPSKPELGSKLLEALQESDKGKRRPGLPQAPDNLFDDSKRGLSKGGWTINLPVGMDVFFIIFSFVFISSVMFATTYIVWKVGAIHFNEY